MATLKLSDYLKTYYYGEAGETLFCEPYPTKIQLQQDSSRDLIVTRNESLDDRSLALVSAMISENYVDRMLKLLLPTFEAKREGAASMKINLLAAFNIVPTHLTTAADLLNKTRNQFAHHLDLTSFAGLDHHAPALVNRMRDLCKKRKIQIPQGPDEVNALFSVIFKLATTGILYYEENVRFYTEFTRTPGFIKTIGEIQSTDVKQHNEMLLEALRQHQSAPNRDDPPFVS